MKAKAMTNAKYIKEFILSGANSKTKSGNLANITLSSGVSILYSYNIPIAMWKGSDLILNTNVYSVTTSRHSTLVEYIYDINKANLPKTNVIYTNNLEHNVQLAKGRIHE